MPLLPWWNRETSPAIREYHGIGKATNLIQLDIWEWRGPRTFHDWIQHFVDKKYEKRKTNRLGSVLNFEKAMPIFDFSCNFTLSWWVPLGKKYIFPIFHVAIRESKKKSNLKALWMRTSTSHIWKSWWRRKNAATPQTLLVSHLPWYVSSHPRPWQYRWDQRVDIGKYLTIWWSIGGLFVDVMLVRSCRSGWSIWHFISQQVQELIHFFSCNTLQAISGGTLRTTQVNHTGTSTDVEDRSFLPCSTLT